MCGICGIIENNNLISPSSSLLKKMCSKIAHRGPDDNGIFIKNNIGLGHQRLSILDLSSAGHQPFISDDKLKVIVYNGEIYNFNELKKILQNKHFFCKTNCDTEVVLKMYEVFGIECLSYFRGMFSFAIYDFKKNQLFAARDRLGQKPFFYAKQDGRFYFASEIKSILADSRFKRKPDLNAINHYLSFKYIPENYSAFQDIKKLEPGHFLLLKNNSIQIKSYWNNWFSQKKIKDINEIKYNLKNLLFESVKLRMISDVPLGAFLSGGIDSSIIVAVMSELSNKPIKSFSIGFEEKRFDESKYALQVAKMYNTEHYNFIVKSDIINDIDKLVWHYNEPFSDPSMLPTYYLSRETKKHVTVALSGDAGDENFAGYLRYLGFKLSGIFNFLPKKIKYNLFDFLLNVIPASTKQQTQYNKFYRLIEVLSKTDIQKYMSMIEDFSYILKNNLYSENFKDNITSIDSSNIIKKHFDKLNVSNLDKLLYTDLKTYLPNDIMTKVDIASMAVSLECRSPFMDHKFVEYASTIHSSLKLKGKTTKFILKDTFKKYIPDNLLNREKAGFSVPISDWFRTDLKNYIPEIFSKKFYERNLFNSDYVKNLISDHLDQKKENGYRIWTLMCLELWFRKFID